MLHNFEDLRKCVGSAEPKTVAVACAHDGHTLEAVLRAAQEGILRYILIGHADEILSAGRTLGCEIDPRDRHKCRHGRGRSAHRRRAHPRRQGDFLQKGLMQTATILKAVVNKQTGIGIGRPMSHVALLEVPGYAKLLGVTDGGMMPNPDLEGKKAIVRNAVEMFHALGYEEPLLSALCAAENVSPKIIETVDAAALKQAALDGEFGRCILEGPISLDLALDAESAKIKGYESPVTGRTDTSSSRACPRETSWSRHSLSLRVQRWRASSSARSALSPSIPEAQALKRSTIPCWSARS